MTVYTTTVPAGVPGTVQDPSSTVESGVYDQATPPLAFGAPVKLKAGLVSAIEAGDAATDFYGILARTNPDQSGDANFNGFGAGAPDATRTASTVVGGPGYITVACTIGTPVKGGAVYMRVVEALPALVGDLEATADGVNNVLLTNAVWDASGKDADNAARLKVTD